MLHKSVLLNESIEHLAIKPDGIYVDGTLGRAGHSSEILKRLSNGHLYGFDKDQQAIKESDPILKEIGNNYTLINQDFRNIKTILNELGIKSWCIISTI